MDKVFEKVKKNILQNELISENDKIVLGVSGGPDSVFLLHVLNKIKEEKLITFDIIIAHINHGIREEAIHDQKFVETLAEKLGYKCYSLEVNVSKIAEEQKISEEECGRNIRYEFFNKILKETSCNKIAVAHNKTDNVETVLMNFIRGAGISGMKGMDFKTKNIIRPMLNIKKDEILEYLKENSIEYVIDKTNSENIYTRNKIRNDLIKKIENEYNPNFLDTVTRMIEINKQDVELLEEYTNKEYEKLKKEKEENKITIYTNKEFLNESYGLKCRVIRKILIELLGNIQGIEKVHVDDICKLITNNITGKRYIIGNKFEIKIIKKNKVEFIKNVILCENN